MTYIEILLLLPEEIRDKAITNVKNDDTSLEWIYLNATLMANPSSVLISSFAWAKSPEGHDFWNSWYSKLLNDEVLQRQNKERDLSIQ